VGEALIGVWDHPYVPSDVTLVTDRLVLRRFRPADVEALAAYRSDPAVARYQSWAVPLSTEEAVELVRVFQAGDPAEPGWFQYAIARRDEDGLIGDIGVNRHENGLQAEIGYTLARAWWGRGYAYEAVSRLLDQLFLVDRLRRVSADTDARNEASARLLDRLGFRREGLRRAHSFIKEEWTDDLLFGLLADEWPPTR
jgi:RimJ/RimL family protein N-acetyltransferase